ncbi:MAG: hypothetical protein JKX70_00415 [Phycisphaerales bacterium]|nr:hypothetical protein [Phycisphaerales bacterium]
MGINIGHVVVGSAVLGLSTFVYIVGFSPMDSAVFPRADAMNAQPTKVGLIGRIRTWAAQGQLAKADKAADQLNTLFPEHPSAHLWRGLVDRMMGDEEAELATWRALDAQMAGLASWTSEFTQAQLDYIRAWGKQGIGEIEAAQALFKSVADDLEERSTKDGDGRVIDPGVLYNLACYRAMSGETEIALGHWERAVERGYQLGSGWWAVDPDLERLRDDDRFWSVVGNSNTSRGRGISTTITPTSPTSPESGPNTNATPEG